MAAGSIPATRSKIIMAKDNLYKKSVAAVFFLTAFGVAVFFYGNNLEKKYNQEIAEQKEKNNLANLISQNKAAPIEGFENLSEEARSAGKNNENPKANSSEELEKLLSSY